MGKKRAVYAGTFDPITNGHLWVIREALSLFDEVAIVLGVNPDKKTLFTVEERLTLIGESVIKPHYHPRSNEPGEIGIDHFENLFLVDYAKRNGFTHIIRGIRNSSDFEFERMMNDFNRDKTPQIKTVFLIPPKELRDVSSSFVKGLIGPEGWEEEVKKLVPEPVFLALLEKFNDNA